MYIEIIVGLFLLWKGADYLVENAVAIAHHMKLDKMLVGLTIVAFGTSAPELLVSVNAALDDSPGLALGNVVGSNIANVLLILGIPAIIYPIPSTARTLKRDVGMLIVITVLFIAFCADMTLTRYEGIVMLILLFSYFTYAYVASKKAQNDLEYLSGEIDPTKGTPPKTWLAIAMAAGGAIALIFGADMMISGASSLARTFGVSDAVIGLTLVAFGTSLPELVTSVVAAFKKHEEIALGNVIGSNMMNLLLVIGATTTIAPIVVPDQMMGYDLWVMLGASALLAPFVLKRWQLGRLVGIAFLIGYFTYVGTQFTA